MRKKGFNPDTALQKAMYFFWDKGYESCSMDELLSEMGLSRSSFYNTFGNKRELYETVLNHFGQLSAMAYQTLHTSKPMLEALNDFFELIFFSPIMKLENGCLLVNTVLEQRGNDDALSNMASEKLFEVEQQFVTFFERCKANGQLNNSLPEAQLAAYFMTFIKGLRVAAREGKPVTELKTSIKTAMLILESPYEK